MKQETVKGQESLRSVHVDWFNLLAPEFYIQILAHLYVKCE